MSSSTHAVPWGQRNWRKSARWMPRGPTGRSAIAARQPTSTSTHPRSMNAGTALRPRPAKTDAPPGVA
eukprot:2081371-Alexandrium_andersonii.AAC.1